MRLRITKEQREAMRAAICHAYSGTNVLGQNICETFGHQKCTRATNAVVRALHKAAKP